MSDDQLIKLMGDVPHNSFILLEDIDVIFTNRAQKSIMGIKKKKTF